MSFSKGTINPLHTERGAADVNTDLIDDPH